MKYWKAYTLALGFVLLVGAATTVPSQLWFTANGTGATRRSHASKLADVISVTDFLPVGYVTDGSVDYTTQIQAALVAAAGRTLYMPAGTYKITSALVPATKTTVAGEGIDLTIITPVGSNGFNLQAQNLELANLTVLGSGYWQTDYSESTTALGSPSTFTGVQVGDGTTYNANKIRLNNVEARDFFKGISITKSYDIHGSVRVVNNKYGLYMIGTDTNNPTQDIHFREIWSEYNGHNVYGNFLVATRIDSLVSQYSRNYAGVYCSVCNSLEIAHVYSEFLSTPADGSAAHPTNAPAPATIYNSDTNPATAVKQFFFLDTTSGWIRNVRMQKYRLGFFLQFCGPLMIEGLQNVNRSNLTLSGVGYDASIISYSNGSDSTYTDLTLIGDLPPPIIPRNGGTAALRGGYTNLTKTGITAEANLFRSVLGASSTNAATTLTFQKEISGFGTAWTDYVVIGAGATAGATISWPTPTTFANLGVPPVNGTMTYCSDCTIANPCAGAGTGAIAKRLNGVWVCN